MVVEDSAFVRGMITEILRALKVGKVVPAPEGGEAIQILRQVSKNPMAAGTLGVDIIMSDYVMSPINGAMLLRWVRQHEDSPDRFVPFIMVSGAADRDKVRESRDLGVSEFLAKPFSVKGVADHLLAVIDTPRPFIYTRDYFGPDRRRQQRPYDAGVDRRVAKPGDLEVIMSGQRLRSLNNQAKAFMFKLPNRLRDKIAGLGGGPMRIDPTLLQAAEKQLDRMESDYSDWVLGTMRQLAEEHRKAQVDDIRKRAQHVVQINKLAHDLRGQGSTFGYPLITVFGRSLFECTTDVGDVSDQLLEFVRTHIDGINAVVREKIKGPGGELGTELVKSLERAREKFTIVA